MPRLFLITVPGLDVRRDWAPVHDRLLDDFPQISDVLATTIAETLLIVYEGEVEVDAWLASMSEGVLSDQLHARRSSRRPQAIGRVRAPAWSRPSTSRMRPFLEAKTDGHIIRSINERKAHSMSK